MESESVKVHLQDVLPQLYADLKRIASSALQKESGRNHVQTTELVHEIYLRLAAIHSIDWSEPGRLERVSVGVVRRILVDYARARKAAKRTPDGTVANPAASLHIGDATTKSTVDLLELEDAIKKLESIDPRKAEIVQLRYFSGMDIEEVASIMSISAATIKRDWALAKAWLRRELS